jgi:hypothetical protein
MSKTGGQGITPPPPLGEDENAQLQKPPQLQQWKSL